MQTPHPENTPHPPRLYALRQPSRINRLSPDPEAKSERRKATENILRNLDPLRVEIRKALPTLILACAVITDRQARPEQKDHELDRDNYFSEQFLRSCKWRTLSPSACKDIRIARAEHGHDSAYTASLKAKYTSLDIPLQRAQALLRAATVALLNLFYYDPTTDLTSAEKLQKAMRASPALLEMLSNTSFESEESLKKLIHLLEDMECDDEVLEEIETVLPKFFTISTCVGVHLRSTRRNRTSYKRARAGFVQAHTLPLTRVGLSPADQLHPSYTRSERGRAERGSITGAEYMWSITTEEMCARFAPRAIGDGGISRVMARIEGHDTPQIDNTTVFAAALSSHAQMNGGDYIGTLIAAALASSARVERGGRHEKPGAAVTHTLNSWRELTPELVASIEASREDVERAVKLYANDPLRDWGMLTTSVSQMLIWASYGVLDHPDNHPDPMTLLERHRESPVIHVNGRSEEDTAPAWIAESSQQDQGYLMIGRLAAGALGEKPRNGSETTSKQIDATLTTLQPMVLAEAHRVLADLVEKLRTTPGQTWFDAWLEETSRLLKEQVVQPEVVACADFLSRIVPNAVNLDARAEEKAPGNRSEETRHRARYGSGEVHNPAYNPLQIYCRRELLYMAQCVGQRTEKQPGLGDVRYTPCVGLATMDTTATADQIVEAANTLADAWVNPRAKKQIGLRGR